MRSAGRDLVRKFVEHVIGTKHYGQIVGDHVAPFDVDHHSRIDLFTIVALINRLVAASGKARRTVYYWYQERGRVVASEIDAMWLRIRDIAFRNRSDAALVRFMIPGDSPEGEARMATFIQEFKPLLDPYLPS